MEKSRWVLRAIPIAAGACLAYLALGGLYGLSPQELAGLAPQGGGLVGLWLLLLFAAKSLSVVLPVLLLQALCGFLFPLPTALVMSMVGTAVSCLVGYAMGRFLGGGKPSKTISRFRPLWEKLRGRYALTACLTRGIGVPLDVGSMTMGAARFPLAPYLWGSLAGALPGAVAGTALGSLFQQPAPMVILLAGAGHLALFALGAYLLRRGRPRPQKSED